MRVMPIANFFIKRILNYIRRETDYDEDDIDLMRYSLEAILWEIEKAVYMFLIFLTLGLHWYFLASVAALLTVRFYAGGFHSSTTWGRFFWSLLGFALALLVLPAVAINTAIVVLVAVFSVMATVAAAPVRSLQMEKIADKSKDKQKKYIVTTITIVWFLIIFLCQHLFLFEVIMWTIFLQNLQLLIEYIKRKFLMGR